MGDIFYLPHNLDFRGRAYAIPPHLNHIGDDLSRGLLLFGEAKPLSERGLRWLKIHLSNLYGYDKATFDERVEFVHKHLDDIYDSAENPLTVSLSTLYFDAIAEALSLRVRGANGGIRPTTHGNAWQLVLSSRPHLNRPTHTRTSARCQCIRTGRVMGCSIMLP